MSVNYCPNWGSTLTAAQKLEEWRHYIRAKAYLRQLDPSYDAERLNRRNKALAKRRDMFRQGKA